MSVIDDIKARTDCRALARARGVRIARASGESWRAHCFHPGSHNNGDKHPSMTIWRNHFKCYGCGAAGDQIDLVMQKDGLDKRGAISTLANEFGIDARRRPTGARRRHKPNRKAAMPSTRHAAKTRRALTDLAAEPLETIDPIRAELWGRIWAALVFSLPTSAAKAWAADRGINWQAVTLASVRDPTNAAGEIVEILKSYKYLAEHQRAGTVKGAKPWYPMRIITEIADGNREAADGAFIPIWHPAHGPSPVGMRYRMYEPMQLASGGVIKSWMQPAGGPSLPLGLDSIDLAERLGEPYSVLLCEGETDWLAAQDAMRQLGRPCACLAHCMMSKPWAASWTRLIADASLAERVLILFDQGNGEPPTGEKRAREIIQQFAALKGADWTRERVTPNLTDETKDDLAAMHKKGGLVPLLQGLTPSRQNQQLPNESELAV